MTKKLDDNLLLDIETNFCRTAYQLKWLTKILEENNTTTTNYQHLNLVSSYPPPNNNELDSKLSKTQGVDILNN